MCCPSKESECMFAAFCKLGLLNNHILGLFWLNNTLAEADPSTYESLPLWNVLKASFVWGVLGWQPDAVPPLSWAQEIGCLKNLFLYCLTELDGLPFWLPVSELLTLKAPDFPCLLLLVWAGIPEQDPLTNPYGNPVQLGGSKYHA